MFTVWSPSAVAAVSHSSIHRAIPPKRWHVFATFPDCWRQLPPPSNHKLQGNSERGQPGGDPGSAVAFPRKQR